MTIKHEPLAICGGSPIIPKGPPSWPPADERIQAALKEAYHSGDWGRYHGRYCEALEKRLCEMHDVNQCKLCSSGTVAVELALQGFDLRPKNEVILGGYDFPGNFRCIEQVGARPVLADIDPEHGCVGVEQLAEAYRPTTRAAIISHLHSGLAPMKSIMEWAQKHNVLIIEDACQAPGAMVDGQLAGSWGDIGVFSFGGSKLLTAGRGGALIVKDSVQMQRIRVFAERGNDAYPLSELQAAVILPQLDKLNERNTQRQQNVAILRRRIEGLRCLTFVGNRNPNTNSAEKSLTNACSPSFYKVAWRYDAANGKWTRNELLAALRAEGVAADEGFRGFTRRSEKRCRHGSALTQSKLAASSTVLLHHPVLLSDEATADSIGQAFAKVIHGYVQGSSSA